MTRAANQRCVTLDYGSAAYNLEAGPDRKFRHMDKSQICSLDSKVMSRRRRNI